MTNPAAAQQMISPAGSQPMVNPAAAPAMANPAADNPMVNMGIAPPAPEAMPTANMADGGVTTLMPTGGFVGYPEDAEDPGNYPQRSSPLQMADGGLTAIPMHGMFKAGSYAGGGIVAFENNEDQPVSVDMPENNTPSANVDSSDDIFRRLVAAQTESDANPPVPIAGSETAEATTSDVNPVATPPAAKPKATAPSSALIPVIEKQPRKTTDEIIADKQYLKQKFGISEDPLAESKAIQAKNYERQQADIAQQPLDRIISSLAAVAKADPTKGIGAIGAAYGEKSQEVAGLQRAYKDKIEESNLQYKTAVAKEEDARKRGDMKGVEDALAAQQKAEFEYGKYMNDFQNTISSRIQAGAASSQAGTAALRAKLEADKNPAYIDHLKAQAERDRAAAEASIAGMEPKEQQAVTNSLKDDPNYKNFSRLQLPRDKGGKDYAPGTPQGDLINDYLRDLQISRAFELKNKLPPGSMAPTPPKIIPETIKEVPGRFFGTNEVPVPAVNEPHKPAIFTPIPVPQGAKPKDLVVGKQVYALPNGNNAIWNGKEFVVVK
jgi:hypothetical protein